MDNSPKNKEDKINDFVKNGGAARAVKIEHTNRRCKCFRIVKDTYRNHLNHISQVWLIVCGLVNLNL
jgi:hypothetical protein